MKLYKLLVIVVLASCSAGKPPPATPIPFDIQAAFANLQDGGTLDIPVGTYYVTDTLSLVNKHYITVHANNASIYKSGDFSGKAILNMAGTNYCSVYGLRINTGAGSGLPVAALVRGRTAQSAGGGCAFYDSEFSGNYTGATVYAVSSEGDSYYNSHFQTETDRPAFIDTNRDILGFGLVESSNDLLWISNSEFKNYGTAPVLFLADGSVSNLSIKDSSIFLGDGGMFIQTNGDAGSITLQDIRAEGSGDALLLDNVGTYLIGLHVSNILWTIPSSYIIQSSNHLLDSEFDFMMSPYGAETAKYIHMTDSGILWRCIVKGRGAGRIVLSDNAQSRGTIYEWFGGHPISEDYNNAGSGNIFMIANDSGSVVATDP